MEADRPAIYRPRRPRASPLWQCVRRHLPELRASGRVRRAVERNVLERFLDCGDPHQGFARIRCGGCGHDFLLAFSCKTRYFCPSGHQKRVLAWGDWVEQFVLRPVAHRQYDGRYSSRSRGAERERPELDEPEAEVSTPARQAAKAAWAKLIRKVYEVDPLECPKCGAQMRAIALIEDPAVIERILTWLGLREPRQPGGPSPPTDSPSLPLTYDAVPDIA